MQCIVTECREKRWQLFILSQWHANLTQPIRYKEGQPCIFNIYLWTTDQDTVAYYKLNSLITTRYIRFIPVVGTRKHSTQSMSVFKKAWLIELDKRKVLWNFRWLDISTMKERESFIIFVNPEKSWKYDAKRNFFEGMRGVWKVDETSSPVPELIPQCKLKLRKTTEKLLYAQPVLINLESPSYLCFPWLNFGNY